VAVLKRSKRCRADFVPMVTKLVMTITTENAKYLLDSFDGKYPDYEKLIPTDGDVTAHLDSVNAIKAIENVRRLTDKAEAVDIIIGDGKITFHNPDDKGIVDLPADTRGNAMYRVSIGYVVNALKACDGMTDLAVKSNGSVQPMLFTSGDFKVVVMPMVLPKPDVVRQAEAVADAKAEAEADGEAEPTGEAVADGEAEPTGEAVAETPNKPKRKRNRKVTESAIA